MSEPKAPSLEDELDAALAALDSGPLPTTTLPDPAPRPKPAAGESPEPMAAPPRSSGSPTLDALGESRRPKASTVCERCPHSVGFASPVAVKCYCRVLFLVTWSSQEPHPIIHCDGAFLGQD